MCSSTFLQWLNLAEAVWVLHQTISYTHKSSWLCSLGPLGAMEHEGMVLCLDFLPGCCCFEWKRLCLFLYIKPHITKPRSSRKSLFSNSLYSASKMPSFQTVSLKQCSEWVDVTWDDFWRLKCRSVREVTSGVECFALPMLCTSLCSDFAGSQTQKELLSFLLLLQSLFWVCST